MISQFHLNSSNLKEGSKNTFIYRLSGGRDFKINSATHQIAVASCSMYNSTFNIREDWNNNKIVIMSELLILANIPAGYNKGSIYIDPITNLSVNRNYVEIKIPDGYFDIPSIQAYLEQQCQLIGLFLKSTDGGSNNYYFFDCKTNPQRYKAQIDLFLIPSSLPNGFMMPTDACFNLPNTAQTFYIYFPSVVTSPTMRLYGSMSRIFGFNGTGGVMLPLNNAPITAESQNLSTETPVVSPITCYLITCNLVRNPISNLENTLLQLSLGNSKFGGIIPHDSYPHYVSCASQTTKEIVIQVFDELNNEVILNDTQFSLVLSLKEEKEQK
jgi:hypothetical protein